MASRPNGGRASLLIDGHPSGDCDEGAILVPLRKHIQIRMAEGADDEDILREVWKWWNHEGKPSRAPAPSPREVVVTVDPTLVETG